MDATIVLATADVERGSRIAGALARAGFRVHHVHDGPTAASSTRAERPDFLLIELWTPGLTGFEVLDDLRAHGGCSGTRIFVLNESPDADAALEATAAGAEAVWPASISPEEIADALLALYNAAATRENELLPGGES